MVLQKIFFFFMYVMSTCMSMSHVQLLWLYRPEMGIRFLLELAITESSYAGDEN